MVGILWTAREIRVLREVSVGGNQEGAGIWRTLERWLWASCSTHVFLLPPHFGRTRHKSGWVGLRLLASKAEQQLGYSQTKLVNKREVPQSWGDLDQSTSGGPRNGKEGWWLCEISYLKSLEKKQYHNSSSTTFFYKLNFLIKVKNQWWHYLNSS